MLFLFKLANETSRKKLEKIFIFAILGTMGAIQLFFGNVEVEASIAAGTIIYIYLAYLSLKKNYSILYPTLALSITIMLKMSIATFLPSLIYLYYAKYGSKIGFRCFLKKDFLKVIIVFLIPILLTLSTMYFYTWKGNPPKDDAERYGSIYAFWCYNDICAPLPLNVLFSKTHLIETLNEYMLFSPLGLVILLFFFIAERKSMKESFFMFLLLMSIFSLLWGFTWVHSYAYKDSWELSSFTSIPYTLLAALLIIKTYNKSLRYLFLVIFMLYLFHTLPWVLSNSLAYSYKVIEEEAKVVFTQINNYII
jgi:hypothetical protein